MKRSAEKVMDIGLQRLAEGKIGMGRLRLEVALREDGLSEDEARVLARQTSRLWTKWLIQMNRRW